MKTIAIIPAYNEEKHIAEVIKKTRKYVNKIIVIDDGSIDSTYDVAKKSKADFVLKHIINAGKGLALQTGFEAAIREKADIVITIDSDGQHNPEDIPRLIKAMKQSNLDIVIGARPLDNNMPAILKFGNAVIQKTFRFLFHLDIKDTQSGYRAFKAVIYPKIRWRTAHYSVETEMLANAGKHGLRVGEIPIKTVYLDKAKGTTVFDGINIFLNMIRLKLFR